MADLAKLMITIAAIEEHLERFAPTRLAAEWDNVGLLLGERAAPVAKIMTCLTVTPESAAEAVEAEANLVIAHHPILFRAIKRLTTATPEGQMLLSLIRANVAVYSPHTAFDNTAGGINEMLASRLALVATGPLRRQRARSQFKVVVFVPDKDLDRVADALFAAGAGQVGQYSQCSFRLPGTGTFFGSDLAHPTVGEKGRREEASEWRLEAICSESSVEPVIKAIRASHSYEEPAYDVYQLRAGFASEGDGRVGRLARPASLAAVARVLKDTLRAGQVQMVGDPGKAVERIAIVCGAGAEMLPDAIRSGADVFLTGEMRFHDYLAAQAQGIALLLAGHYATERFGVEELASALQKKWPELRIWASERERDPISGVVS